MNNDRFKFRAWCEKFKVYAPINCSFSIPGEPYNIAFDPVHISADGRLYEVNNYDGKEVCQVEDVTECYTIEQCTGLKDKNGKLIFEGDVVKTKDFGKDIDNRINVNDYDTFVVKFHECGFYIENDSRRFPMSCRPKLEIIGNIHEMKGTKNEP